MKRRTFLGALLTGALVALASRLPWMRYGAVFRVTQVDPDGSGMDYSGHEGSYVYNAQRCCKNCTLIFAAFAPGGDVDNGPEFCHGELTPINGAARRMMAEVKAKNAAMASGEHTSAFALAV